MPTSKAFITVEFEKIGGEPWSNLHGIKGKSNLWSVSRSWMTCPLPVREWMFNKSKIMLELPFLTVGIIELAR